MDKDEIRQLYDYNRWANARTFDAAERLTDAEFARALGGSFPSVRETLVHLVWAEWVWLRRWLGESPRERFDAAEFSNVAAVRSRWDEIERERAEFIVGIDEARLGAVVAYVNAAGEEWRYPLGQMMLHVANHSTYHRGQVATLLRQLGAAAPSTDFLYYIDESPVAR